MLRNKYKTDLDGLSEAGREGLITPSIEASIFADTQDEPGAEQRRLGLPDPEGSVYAHLDWLQAQPTRGAIPILVRTKGKLSADLMRGENSTGQRFASIQAYTLRPDGNEGQTRRQCSMEYKIEVINRTIRRELCGCAAGHGPRSMVTASRPWFQLHRTAAGQSCGHLVTRSLAGVERAIAVSILLKMCVNY